MLSTTIGTAQYNYANGVSYLVLRATVKYRTHAIIVNLEEVCQKKTPLSLSSVDKQDEIFKEILTLENTKVFQTSNISSEVIKGNVYIFLQCLLIPHILQDS